MMLGSQHSCRRKKMPALPPRGGLLPLAARMPAITIGVHPRKQHTRLPKAPYRWKTSNEGKVQEDC
jgi:hypothetical protein